MNFSSIFSNELFLAAILILGGFLAGKTVKYLLRFVEKRIAFKTNTSLDDKIIGLLKGKTTTTFVLIGTYIAITELQGTYINDYNVSRVLHYVRNGYYIFALAFAANFSLQLMKSVVEWYFDEQLDTDKERVSETVTPLIVKFLTIVVAFGTSIIVLDHFGVNIGSLLVSLGVGSLAIALAAQETIANMIAGIVIMIDRPFHVGDRIQLQTGEIGDVVQLGLRSTRIMNFDKNIIVAPNAELVKNRIVNYSFPTAMIRAVVRVTVAYNSDVQKVKTMLLDLFSSHQNILKEPKPDVNLIDLTTIGMNFECVGFTNDYKKRFETETQLRENIIEAFRKEGIEIPVQQIVQMK
ncbi:MAG: mechanosensitive ion channel family protein [Ignavibacteriales bacterium]|nr:mechanosensitive ion channel family protein [Ignavibacteriales bacterium]